MQYLNADCILIYLSAGSTTAPDCGERFSIQMQVKHRLPAATLRFYEHAIAFCAIVVVVVFFVAGIAITVGNHKQFTKICDVN